MNTNTTAPTGVVSSTEFGVWLPIETAPKDGTRVLLYWPMFYQGPYEEFGCWNTERYKIKPRPYWSGDQEPVYGVRMYRNTQPTHWMPRPPPPNTELKGRHEEN
jgi:hypothetical protein